MRKPRPSAARLLNEVRRYCAAHDVDAQTLAQEVPTSTSDARAWLAPEKDGGVRTLKYLSESKLKAWLETRLEMDAMPEMVRRTDPPAEEQLEFNFESPITRDELLATVAQQAKLIAQLINQRK